MASIGKILIKRVLPTLILLGSYFFYVSAQPNIIMIVSDDQAWTDFGFMGHPAIKTPHIDKLAAQSAVFTNGYVPSSLCRPSLATLLTGQYPSEHKICFNDPPKEYAKTTRFDYIEEAPSLPRLLQQKGYMSLQTGKFWEGHFSRGGFTHGMTTEGRHGDEGLKIGRETMQPVYDFIKEAKQTKKPFFLWYAPFLPHKPHNPPDRLLSKYSTLGLPIPIAKYWAMCEWLDETVGDLMNYVEKEGLTENTMVLFVVDNGWIQGITDVGEGYAPKSKRSPYDGGLRTPVMVKWPGKIKPARYEQVVSSLDFAPSILSAAGLKTPESMSGINFLPFLTANKKYARDYVDGEIFHHDAIDLDYPSRALINIWVRKGNYKLISYMNSHEPDELYDLSKDPYEEKNVVQENEETYKELKKLVHERYKKILLAELK